VIGRKCSARSRRFNTPIGRSMNEDRENQSGKSSLVEQVSDLAGWVGKIVSGDLGPDLPGEMVGAKSLECWVRVLTSLRTARERGWAW
jgi:hypothetical protein